MTINKQALRGQSVDSNFYLAECCNCGRVMPSSKLIESRNYMDGDADCYCPHCNADDCDISDMGSAASEAWNYQQKRVDALLDELEAAEKRIAELTGKPANEYADDADLLFEIDFCDDLSTSIQVAQWLKELRIRRASGIITKVGE